ncbi:DUF969 domain-containing protein [Paraburkholderia phytofirmans]|uniref:DUF969 domain-containing protein n=1 Tax=Paraburkholderia phytofirmans (strain DSM 17436 / LMG 22146 / PsJN) TaxID=398527 RepID=B2TB87_PARPJ|nr:DUF969 domain-containing protein [Paraburkholderia phytofirmans]ACD20829.1 protein of unknown function DUF969 [Paraburkholderia phytofirmans PsJN]
MNTAINFWPLIGVAVVAVGFILRLNPMMIVSVAAVITGFLAKMSFHDILAVMGVAFIKFRNLPLITLLPLPIIGLLERHGLREFVQTAIGKVRAATTGRFLICYLFVRETSASVGLVSLGGQAQMVRPLIAPMAESVAESQHGKLAPHQAHRIRAFAAASDNIGLFFGEDIFIAFGGVLFMQAALRTAGIEVSAIQIAFAGIPTAICVFLIHSFRLYRLDAWLERDIKRSLEQTKVPAVNQECRS